MDIYDFLQPKDGSSDCFIFAQMNDEKVALNTFLYHNKEKAMEWLNSLGGSELGKIENWVLLSDCSGKCYVMTAGTFQQHTKHWQKAADLFFILSELNNKSTYDKSLTPLRVEEYFTRSFFDSLKKKEEPEEEITPEKREETQIKKFLEQKTPKITTFHILNLNTPEGRGIFPFDTKKEAMDFINSDKESRTFAVTEDYEKYYVMERSVFYQHWSYHNIQNLVFEVYKEAKEEDPDGCIKVVKFKFFVRSNEKRTPFVNPYLTPEQKDYFMANLDIGYTAKNFFICVYKDQLGTYKKFKFLSDAIDFCIEIANKFTGVILENETDPYYLVMPKDDFLIYPKHLSKEEVLKRSMNQKSLERKIDNYPETKREDFAILRYSGTHEKNEAYDQIVLTKDEFEDYYPLSRELALDLKSRLMAEGIETKILTVTNPKADACMEQYKRGSFWLETKDAPDQVSNLEQPSKPEPLPDVFDHIAKIWVSPSELYNKPLHGWILERFKEGLDAIEPSNTQLIDSPIYKVYLEQKKRDWEEENCPFEEEEECCANYGEQEEGEKKIPGVLPFGGYWRLEVEEEKKEPKYKPFFILPLIVLTHAATVYFLNHGGMEMVENWLNALFQLLK